VSSREKLRLIAKILQTSSVDDEKSMLAAVEIGVEVLADALEALELSATSLKRIADYLDAGNGDGK